MLADIRFALRLFRRAPLATLIALASIALSVSAPAAVFAAVKSVLLDPLPYARPSQLVQARSDYPRMQQQSQGDWVVWNDTIEINRRTRTLGPLGAFANAVFDLAGDAGTVPEAHYGLRMNTDLFPVLGVAPMIGRNLLPGEDRPGHPDVMILSYGLWTRRFHQDRSIVGRTVTANGHACLVIGVMPPEFNFPMRREAAHTPAPYVEFWAAPLRQSKNPNGGLGTVARLRPGVSLDQARADLASISAALEREFPVTNRDRVIGINALRDRALGAAPRNLWMLLAAAALFMLIGCANVANLLLARGLAREREMAIRFAVGAARGRIFRQLTVESCVLAVAGGLCGFALTWAAWSILPAIAPVSIPRLAAARADAGVFEFAVALALLNGLLFGLAPAFRMARSTALRTHASPAGRDRMRSTLVAAEIAVAALIAVTGAQVLSAFLRLIGTDPGFNARGVIASVVLPAPERYPDPDQRAIFFKKILDAARAIPGVESAGTVDALPFSGENHGGSVSPGGLYDPRELIAEVDVAGGQYLQTMGAQLVEGRWFRDDEMNATGDAAIVSTSVARRLWPGAHPIGRRICLFCTPENRGEWKRVIGVVSNMAHIGLDQAEIGNVYLAAGAMEHSVFVVVRTARPADEMEQAVRRAIAAIDPNQPVFLSATMGNLVADSVADRRFLVTLLSVTGCIALLLAAAGVYGVASYSTARRTQEIGIRMAVGAQPRDVFSLIFRQAFPTVAIGLAIGLGAACIVIRLLRGVLFGLGAIGSADLWIAVAAVGLTAALACWIPAVRATRADPLAALRRD